MKFVAMTFASMALMFSLSFGTISLIKSETAYAQEQAVEVVQHEQSSEVIVEEVPALCKDSEGQPKVCTNEDFFAALATSIGGIKGLGALGVAGVIVNLIMFFLYSPIGNSVLPKKFETEGYKLLLALFLYMVSGVIGLMLPPTSLSFGAALIHSTTLAAFGVLFNQIGKKYIKSKASAALAK